MARKYERAAQELQEAVYTALVSAYDEGYSVGRVRNVTHGKKLLVEFDEPEFGYMLTCAVRAALQEPASVFRVCNFITPMLQYLDYVTLWTMEQDIKNRAEQIAAGDPTLAAVWNTFQLQVSVMRNRKEK